LFSQKGDILRNQLTFDTSTTAELANYSDNVEFVDHYPFIPYQYLLVQKVFEAIRKVGLPVNISPVVNVLCWMHSRMPHASR
jgi:hypothetical protein